MGKRLSKASEGGRFDVLRVWEDVTKSELQEVSGMQVLIRSKVRPDPFPSGLPMSVYGDFLQH